MREAISSKWEIFGDREVYLGCGVSSRTSSLRVKPCKNHGYKAVQSGAEMFAPFTEDCHEKPIVDADH